MNSLELFSGAGGLAKGLELSGFKHSALVEFNKHAYGSLCENFNAEKVFFGDVRDFDLANIRQNRSCRRWVAMSTIFTRW
jgi:DNA (cytosine-5)-methyltransferase 1